MSEEQPQTEVIEEDRSELESALGIQKSHVSVIEAGDERFTKAELEILQSNALTEEDDPFHILSSEQQGMLIKPTINPVYFAQLCQQNNTLLQCVTAMEVNIDGTGWVLEPVSGEEPTTAEEKMIEQVSDLFKEPFPDESFITLRRKLRRDIEGIGMAFMEVIRSIDGTIAFFNYLDAKLTRLVRLDEPVLVELKIMRNGKELTVKFLRRERRYAQLIGRKLRYFKEFGVERDLDKVTGKWETQAPVEDGNSATEVIMFTAHKDVSTAYGVPRYINQIPSVLGSRLAEEFNLEFFKSGGLPPAIILVQGGGLSSDDRKLVTGYLAGKAKFKQRGLLLEVFATGGTLEKTGNVRVTVERFGAERQGDSMFEGYDKRSAMRVRSAFRLPQLFLGISEDMNFATAYTSYMVAEAQVFQPERDEFDEVINVKIMKEIAPDLKFRSLPLSVNDVEKQIKAADTVKDSVTRESFVDNINEIAHTNFVVEEGMSEDELIDTVMQRVAQQGGQEAQNAKPVNDNEEEIKAASAAAVVFSKDGEISKMADDLLYELADDWSALMAGDKVFADDSIRIMRKMVDALNPATRKLFNGYVGMKMMDKEPFDFEGTSDLLACAGDCLDPDVGKTSHKKKKKKG